MCNRLLSTVRSESCVTHGSVEVVECYRIPLRGSAEELARKRSVRKSRPPGGIALGACSLCSECPYKDTQTTGGVQ